MTSFRAPGRINLIGEHTDYNDGFVMPVAIDRYTTVNAERRGDRRLHLSSRGYNNGVEIDLADVDGRPTGSWSDYVRGVAAVLQRQGHALIGADLAIDSNVPPGAGLSARIGTGASNMVCLMSSLIVSAVKGR